MTETRTGAIVDLLSRDHEAAKRLLEEVTNAPAAARGSLFWELVPELVRHEVAEEVVVYPAIRSEAPDGETEVAPRLKEQRAAEELLSSMEKIDPASAEFEKKMTVLHDDVLAHAQAEEEHIFPLLRALEDEQELARLGTRYEKAKASAPTHPHPNAPDTPPGNKIIGPIAAFADKIRDAAKNV